MKTVENVLLYTTERDMRMKHWLVGCLYWVCCACSAISSMDPLTMYQKINPDSSCTSYKIIGACMVGPVVVGYFVSMNVPVAFIETVGRPGDSLLAVPTFNTLIQAVVGKGVGAALSVGQSNHSGLDNSFEAKVWQLPDSVMLLSKIEPKCLICMPSDSVDYTVPLPPVPLGCDSLASVSGAITSMRQKLPAIPYLPSLAYLSEVDFLNWRTGCGDMTFTDILKSNQFTCTAAALAGQAGNVISKVGISNPLSKFFESDICLGSWGSLFPRQMRDIGNVAPVASAKTAYRALSLAKTQFQTVKFPVNLKGKLQQAYPAVSACFKPGDSPLPMAPTSSKPVVTSSDGAYGWIYWQPVTCCVKFQSLAKCAQNK